MTPLNLTVKMSSKPCGQSFSSTLEDLNPITSPNISLGVLSPPSPNSPNPLDMFCDTKGNTFDASSEDEYLSPHSRANPSISLNSPTKNPCNISSCEENSENFKLMESKSLRGCHDDLNLLDDSYVCSENPPLADSKGEESSHILSDVKNNSSCLKDIYPLNSPSDKSPLQNTFVKKPILKPAVTEISDLNSGNSGFGKTAYGSKNEKYLESHSDSVARAKDPILFPQLQSINNAIFLVNCDNVSLQDEVKKHFVPQKDVPGNQSFCNPFKKSGTNTNESLSLPINVIKDGDEGSESIKNRENTNSVYISPHPNLDNVSDDTIEEGNAPDLTVSRKNENEHFTVQKHCSIDLDPRIWEDLYERRHENKNGHETLPSDWTDVIACALAEVLPFCSLVFRRHKIFKQKDAEIAKFWYYCKIGKCDLDGIAILKSSFRVDVFNKNTNLEHVKGESKSFQSRYVKGKNRKILGEKAVDMTYPSKLYHRKLSALNDDLFNKGNLKDVPQSKNVIRQCGYEYRKSTQADDSLIKSLKLLKCKYEEEMKGKSLSGYIQFISLDPLAIGLWCEKDLELFHQMAKSHSLFVDATASVCTKINNKEVYYFSFLSYDKSVKIEPVPQIDHQPIH